MHALPPELVVRWSSRNTVLEGSAQTPEPAVRTSSCNRVLNGSAQSPELVVHTGSRQIGSSMELQCCTAATGNCHILKSFKSWSLLGKFMRGARCHLHRHLQPGGCTRAATVRLPKAWSTTTIPIRPRPCDSPTYSLGIYVLLTAWRHSKNTISRQHEQTGTSFKS